MGRKGVRQAVQEGGRENAYKICVTVWPKALVVTCCTMVLPALDGV